MKITKKSINSNKKPKLNKNQTKLNKNQTKLNKNKKNSNKKPKQNKNQTKINKKPKQNKNQTKQNKNQTKQNKNIKVKLITYGCALNQYDSDEMKYYLLKDKIKIIEDEIQADVVVINSCTVKLQTENKIFDKLKKLQKQNKKFVIAGCLHINKKRIFKEIKNPVIVSPQALEKITTAINFALNEKSGIFDKINRTFSNNFIITPKIAKIGINVGCMGNCSFCQTKLARRKLISQSPKQIIKKIKLAVEKGCNEIDLTSQDSGAYGLDINTNLIFLLNQCKEIKGNFLIRLGMINPHHAKKYKKDLIKILNHEKFYKFLHIPIQSASNDVLKNMNRIGNIQDFYKTIKFFKKNIKNLTISTDIITGFPLEREMDHNLTLKMLKDLKFDIVNVSKYTVRDKTTSKKLKQLDSNIIKKRSREISNLIKQLIIKNNKKLINKEMQGFILNTRKIENIEYLILKTNNYKEVLIKNTKQIKSLNSIKNDKQNKIKIIKIKNLKLFGKLI